ncbi:MAG: TonB-dependent receptor plug domain-containing protein [Caulobacteraceae bacterium]|nr:TonB-dependent receptor plug domain-containing protein [Caulobacteraceae bacterium]
MKLRGMTVAVAAAALATAANAQEAANTAQATPQEAAPQEGVISYPPEFFASAQPQSAMDMINRVPGFQFDGGDSVRGFNGAAGNVLIDGQRPASKADPLENILRRIPATTVERIELIRGGAPGIDMQGKTVLVNVVRKQTASQQALWAVASGFYADGRTTPAMRLEGSRREGDRAMEGSVLLYTFVDDGAGEGPRITYDRAGGTVLERAFSDETAGGRGVETKASYEQGLLGGKVRLSYSGKREVYNWDLEDTTNYPFFYRFRAHDDFDTNFQGEVGLQWSRNLGPRTAIELLALQTWRDTDYLSTFDDTVDNFVFTQASTNGESIVRGKARYTWSDTLTVEGGAEVAYNFLDRTSTFTFNGAPIAIPAASVLVEETRGEVFGTATWRAMPTLTVEAGARFEYSVISQSGDSNLEQEFFYPKPRLFVTWAPNEANQVRLRIEREVGQLNFGDFVSSAQLSTGVVTAGNQDLVPGKAWTYEIAYERRFWEKGALVLLAQYSDMEDVVDRVPVVDLSTCPIVGGEPDPTSPLCEVFSGVGNIPEGRNFHYEVQLTLPLDRLWVKGGLLTFSGTWRDSEVEDPTTGEVREISGQPPFTGNAAFTQDIPAWRLNWGFDVGIGFKDYYYNIDEVDSEELQSWWRLWQEWKPMPSLSIRMEFQNLAARDLIRTRDVYTGLRDTSALLFHERKDLNFDPFFYMRIRKTW